MKFKIDENLDIRFNPPEASPGCLVLRLKSQARPSVISALKRVLRNKLWIVDESTVRVRGV